MDQDKKRGADQAKYIDSLRKELIYLVERELTPVALKYRYSQVPLESKVKWKPIVLILGNYSSGKSTLINEVLGMPVQLSGQAPTDDCFTVITAPDQLENLEGYEAEVDGPTEKGQNGDIEERNGKVLLNDSSYPFELLKKHGERFASHFRLKTVHGSERLQNLAIIDTPGMLDSVTENDRGYDYQEVIGDLAQLADLVILMFDPHKAGTVQESYASLRKTLPERTYEDRLLFVLNRVDECQSLEDLIRVYGTLCWNLSQMTGRKDIPRILLTYSNEAAKQIEEKEFLKFYENQRNELVESIFNAPKHRLDHLASFVESHASRLVRLLESLIEYNRRKRNFSLKFNMIGLGSSILFGAISGLYVDIVQPFGEISTELSMAWSLSLATGLYVGWNFILYRYILKLFHRRALEDLEDLCPQVDQRQRDQWFSIKDALRECLENTRKLSTTSVLRRELEKVQEIYSKSAQEIRSAINKLSVIRRGQSKP